VNQRAANVVNDRGASIIAELDGSNRWQRELSRAESRDDFGECAVDFTRELNGILIRFAQAVRRSFKAGSLLWRSVKGTVQESGGDRPEKGEVFMVIVGMVA